MIGLNIAGGGVHSLALKSDKTLWAWGTEHERTLGDGTAAGQKFPVKIGTDTNWESVISRGVLLLALKSDRSLWAWETTLMDSWEMARSLEKFPY